MVSHPCSCGREWGLSVDGEHAVLVKSGREALEQMTSVGRSDGGRFACLHQEGRVLFDLRGPVQVQRKRGQHEHTATD